MSWGAISDDLWAGEVRLAAPDAKARFLGEASAGGLLLIELEPPRPVVRGRLALFVEGAIERALQARGAPSAAHPSTVGWDETLDDQLHLATVSGALGIALWFSSLEAIAGPGRALDSADSGTLRSWIAVANERPI